MPNSARFAWPKKNGPWSVTLSWSQVQGRPELVGLTIRSFEEDGEEPKLLAEGAELRPLTAAVVRGLPFGRLFAAKLQDAAAEFEGSDDPQAREYARRLRRDLAEARAAGRQPGYGPEHYAQVASMYLRLLGAGRNPTQSIADQFRVPKSTAAKWIGRARGMGLLPPAPGRGRAGGGVPDHWGRDVPFPSPEVLLSLREAGELEAIWKAERRKRGRKR